MHKQSEERMAIFFGFGLLVLLLLAFCAALNIDMKPLFGILFFLTSAAFLYFSFSYERKKARDSSQMFYQPGQQPKQATTTTAAQEYITVQEMQTASEQHPQAMYPHMPPPQ